MWGKVAAREKRKHATTFEIEERQSPRAHPLFLVLLRRLRFSSTKVVVNRKKAC
jgi:hypothetical protein